MEFDDRLVRILFDAAYLSTLLFAGLCRSAKQDASYIFTAHVAT